MKLEPEINRCIFGMADVLKNNITSDLLVANTTNALNLTEDDINNIINVVITNVEKNTRATAVGIVNLIENNKDKK